MIYRLIIFFIINFASIGLGSVLAGKGPRSEWYANLNKAPWTPPGWAFGLSWTIIMICFSIYLSYLWPIVENRKLLVGILILHYILNLSWNPVFFYYHRMMPGLFIIASLTLVIGFIMFFYWKEMNSLSLLVAPYLIWLVIATSLNAYTLARN